MSSRNMRRLARERDEKEKQEKEKEEEIVAEEFQPSYIQVNNPAFEGLEVEKSDDSACAESSSSSEPYQDEAAAIPEKDKYGTKKKKTVNKKKKNEKPPRSEDSARDESISSSEPYQDEAAAIPEEDRYGAKKKTTVNNNKKKNKKKPKKPNPNTDEVDEAVNEVYRMLGTPEQVVKKVEKIEDIELQRQRKIFNIHPNNINVNNELAREVGDNANRSRRRPGMRKTRHEIGLSPDVVPFQVKGISMTCYKTEGHLKYFKFEHSTDYQTRYRNLILEIRATLYRNVQPRLHAEICVEALLENCDFLYLIEEHSSANRALEQAIYCMQSVGAPSFNFVDGLTRLPYLYVENRPFHIAILKYLHVLTNIACHRTALELAKVLLNLDPSDPLAVILMIDTLALRAREFQWLLDLVEYWKEKRQPQRLYHMRYSIALAMFQVACKNKDHNGVEHAKAALMTAIKEYPPVATRLIEFARMPVPENIRNHAIFVPPPNIAVSSVVNELMTLYAWMNVSRWREGRVWRWFIDTLVDLCEKYDRDPLVDVEIRHMARVRAALYRKFPTQIKRHLFVLSSMGKYVFDNIPEETVQRRPPTIVCNPYPNEGDAEDQYSYYTEWRTHLDQERGNAFLALIQDIYPEMYQLGRQNMREMLRRMDGLIIKVENGHFMVAGPKTSGASPSELVTYWIIQLDSNLAADLQPHEIEEYYRRLNQNIPDPQDENDQGLQDENGQGPLDENGWRVLDELDQEHENRYGRGPDSLPLLQNNLHRDGTDPRRMQDENGQGPQDENSQGLHDENGWRVLDELDQEHENRYGREPDSLPLLQNNLHRDGTDPRGMQDENGQGPQDEISPRHQDEIGPGPQDENYPDPIDVNGQRVLDEIEQEHENRYGLPALPALLPNNHGIEGAHQLQDENASFRPLNAFQPHHYGNAALPARRTLFPNVAVGRGSHIGQQRPNIVVEPNQPEGAGQPYLRPALARPSPQMREIQLREIAAARRRNAGRLRDYPPREINENK